MYRERFNPQTCKHPFIIVVLTSPACEQNKGKQCIPWNLLIIVKSGLRIQQRLQLAYIFVSELTKTKISRLFSGVKPANKSLFINLKLLDKHQRANSPVTPWQPAESDQLLTDKVT